MSTPTTDPDCSTGMCPPLTTSLEPSNPAPVTSSQASSAAPSAPQSPESSSTAAPTTNEGSPTNPAPVTSASISSSVPTTEVKTQDQSDPALLDPSTFVEPLVEHLPGWRVVIEFCDRCRWLHRACWVQTELFLTFPSPAIKAISLIPLNSPETGGRFRVWLFEGKDDAESGDGKGELVWDRKIEGGFPELKLLKQRIRNHISPKASLGHSDKTSGKAEA